jgi:hypothetical protein
VGGHYVIDGHFWRTHPNGRLNTAKNQGRGIGVHNAMIKVVADSKTF